MDSKAPNKAKTQIGSGRFKRRQICVLGKNGRPMNGREGKFAVCGFSADVVTRVANVASDVGHGSRTLFLHFSSAGFPFGPLTH